MIKILLTILLKVKEKVNNLITFLKQNPKDIIYIIAIIVVLCIAGTMFSREKTIFISKDNTDLLEQVNTYRDKQGKLVAQLTQKYIEKDELLKRTDSLANLLKLKTKNIKEVDQYHVITDTVFVDLPTKIIVNHDTINNTIDTLYTVTKKDGWINIEAKVNRVSGSIKVSGIDTLTRVVSNKFHLFKPDETIITLKNSSPYNRITEGYSFSIKEKPVLFDVSLQLGYNPLSKQSYIGIGISKSLFKIKN